MSTIQISDTKIDHLFLTGGTGFFGRSLLRYWLTVEPSQERPRRVSILTRSPESFLTRYPEFADVPWLQLYKGDILNPKTFPKSTSYSHCLHAATDSTLGPLLTPLDRFNQIVEGTRNVLNYAAQTEISRLLFTSSGGVYGALPEGMHSYEEDFHGMADALEPQNAYSIAKRAAEHLCSLYADRYNISAVIARCFAFVGHDLPMDGHFAIGNFILDAINNRPIKITGDGQAVRSYMDQRDLARWLTVLTACGKANNAYNVGSDTPITIGELARTVRNLLAPRAQVVFGETPADSGSRRRYLPSIVKARATMGLDLSYSLEESIVEAARSYRSCK